MIYVDTSVVLAHVFSEPTRPPDALWTSGDLISSRLAEFEAWVRVNAYGRATACGPVLVETLDRIDLVELDEAACARCRAPFPGSVRALDALHLSTADHLRNQGLTVRVATYDLRMRDAARSLGFELFDL